MANTDANKVNDFEEILNRAMEIHAQNAIQGLPFNKTELAEIVDITNHDSGRYVVWNGSTRYEAISENTAYKMGMKVYVNIPNNDFTGQKTIIGQYRQDGETAVFYKSPLEMYEPLSADLIKDTTYSPSENPTGEYELLMNRKIAGDVTSEPGPQTLTIFEASGLQSSPYNGYKYMGISADFKSLLGGFSPTTGDYGLRVVVKYIQENEVTDDTKIKEKIFTLSAVKDMFGDVYNFKTYFPQEALYNVEDLIIDSVKVEFYQDGNFLNTEGNLITYDTTGIIGKIPNNIFMKNLSIVFGNDPISDNDRVKIYPLNGTTYDSAQKESLNLKAIKLQWTHLNPDTNEYEVLETSSAARKISDLDSYTIHWYRDSIYETSDYTDVISAETDAAKKSKLYEAIATDLENEAPKESMDTYARFVSTFKLRAGTHYGVNGGVYLITPDGKAYAERQVESALRTAEAQKTKAADDLAGPFWTAITESKDAWEIKDFLPDLKRSLSKVKVVITYGAGDNLVQIESNELQFNNLREVLDDDKSNRMSIAFRDGTNGDYPIYNSTDGKLLSRLEVKDRILEADLLDSRGKSCLNGNEIIIWQLPKIGSMIQFVSPALTANNGVELLEDDEIFSQYPKDIQHNDRYYFIKREAINTKGNSVSKTQTYRIAEYFNKGNTNNTVFCYIIKNNEIFKQSVTMTFNQHGTSGTDYTFTLGLGPKVTSDWEVVGPADTALTIGEATSDNRAIYNEIVFDLFNSKNEKIELTPQQKNAIIKKWMAVDVTGGGYYLTTQASKNNLQFITQEDENENSVRVAVRAPLTNTEGNRNGTYSFNNITFQAEIKDVVEELGNEVNFVQLMPLHVRAANTHWVLNGSDYVVYDDKGANPQYYNDKYELIDPTKESTDEGYKLEQYFWIRSNNTANDEAGQYIPHFSSEDKHSGKLVPPPLFVSDVGATWIECSQNDHTDSANGIYYNWQYTFPLIIIQNKYGVPALNKWNGDLLVDAAGNKILTAMVGAGHKDAENTFTGVVMGDVEHQDPYDGNRLKKSTGLFGYKEGGQTFGFDTDGTAFLGKSGNGRIYVDGNTGKITSAAREAYDIAHEQYINEIRDENGQLLREEDDTDPRGTEINLKENYIQIDGIGNKAQVQMSVDGSSKPYFRIQSTAGNRLLEINKVNYYLQTDNYSETAGTGLKIDLANGILNSYNKLTINGASGSKIHFGGNTKYLELGYDGTNAYLTSTDKLSLRAGTLGANSSFYLSNTNGSGTVAQTQRTDWRLTLGQNFGVTQNGALYAKAGKIGDVEIVDGNLRVQKLWIGDTPFTPQDVSFVTSVSVTADTGTITNTITTVEVDQEKSYFAQVLNADAIFYQGASGYIYYLESSNGITSILSAKYKGVQHSISTSVVKSITVSYDKWSGKILGGSSTAGGSNTWSRSL